MILLILFLILLPVIHHDTLVIEPVYTQSAYDKDCWYHTANTTCEIKPQCNYGGSCYGLFLLSLMGYTHISDIEVTDSILQKYDRVILLHNEYVTRQEYNAIMNHSNVFYLYPNALYKFVFIEDNHTMTIDAFTGNEKSLSKWGIVNEFNQCSFTYEIVKYDNGIGINCYPENSLITLLRIAIFTN